MSKKAPIDEGLRSLGPWPTGINNVVDQHAAVFQPTEKQTAALRTAENVDLDNDGWPRRRVGRTKLRDLTDGHSLYAAPDGLYYVDAGTLYSQPTPLHDPVEIATDVGSNALSYAFVAGQLWWMSPSARGCVVGGESKPWGLQVPALAVSPTPGQAPAGRYLVSATVESGGLESGAPLPAVIELDGSSDIAVTLVGVDPAADFVNLYCSDTNGQELYWVHTHPVGTAFTIGNVRQSGDPLDTFNHYPPPLGQICRLFSGRMLVASDNALYWSQPLAYHHFALAEDAQVFDSRIVLVEPLAGGFFIATQTATFWVSGDDPHTWSPSVVDRARVSEGTALRLPGDKIPALKQSGEVLIWATSDGFVAGTTDRGQGVVQRLTAGTVAMDAYARASFAFREESGIRQVLMAKQQQAEGNRFGATDRVTVRITRGDQVEVSEP